MQSMTGQLPLDIGFPPSFAAADFLVSASNAAASAWVERWPDWPGPALAVCGPPGCGKTHLAHVWQRRSHALLIHAGQLIEHMREPLSGMVGACIVDGIPALGPGAAERALLHLYNITVERRGHLMLCAEAPPARWSVALADLRSRLATIPVASIEPPDDGLLEAVLAKLFADRQLAVDRGTTIYMVARMERSFAAARALVGAIDRAALAAHRRPSLGLVREVMERLDGKTM
jgi:chromosomal replication initiation ATPase DnaA